MSNPALPVEMSLTYLKSRPAAGNFDSGERTGMHLVLPWSDMQAELPHLEAASTHANRIKEVSVMTSLVRFTPRNDLRRMQRDFDRLFNTFFPSESEEEGSAVSWTPRLDVIETSEAFEVEMDIPGVEKDDITINVHDGILSISGERASREVEEADNVVRVERNTGRFYRSFSLPTKIDDSKIEASHTNGVLRVRLPKVEESKPRKISIS